ncbi:Cytidyltransferase-like domain and Rossmann-like alpha/beta/alpha sandwich fold domain-containing protein [Strongyloides ratti]|uniref:choline-phosphate cytidylyltransferase n=1 Tax=Strongyloides ratti TaxID=34506 RepID=A0A090N0R3_STRRB|nr:Cytidyltransferase-like domain and Rossmann-like alpha/beta/alpha sandwich fold domain-containing protein [Strongyloides ratti]CEF71138.1 Cytidyltransferase-like domain and Rossmann-like alpha/beta/alpha sandwich fold domain-containing protein [Strongyloides ratti]
MMIGKEFIPQKVIIKKNGVLEFDSIKRQPKIYADGVFDLFHIGHAKLFEQIKKMVPNCILIVGVVTDEDSYKNKGSYPIMNHLERCEVVRSCKFVDELIMNPPFYPTIEFINHHEIDIVAHDNIPYPVVGMEDCYKPFKEANRFLPTQRENFVSSTDIVKRILNNYDSFVKMEKFQNI